MIRDASPRDCEALSALAFTSKAHWGYDDAFMAACRDELTVRPADLTRVRVRVAVDDAIVGFHGVEGDDLSWFFVAPGAMGRGVGAALFADACATARAAGVERLSIGADPFAAAFYERMGAVRIGEEPSASIPGRMLPVLVMDISSTA